MKLETHLRQKGVHFEKSSHRATYTSQGLAAEEHVPGSKVAKAVIVRCDSGYLMCVVPACARLSLQRVAEVLNVLSVRLATESEMARLFPECELGAEPPIGKLFGLKTIVDRTLHRADYVVMQAGTHTDSVKIDREDWERLCEPIVADISTRADDRHQD